MVASQKKNQVKLACGHINKHLWHNKETIVSDAKYILSNDNCHALIFLMKSVCAVIPSRQKSSSHRAKWQATMRKKIEILQKTHLHSAFLWTTHKEVTTHVISHSNESKMTCSQKKKKPKRLNLNFAQSLCSHTI